MFRESLHWRQLSDALLTLILSVMLAGENAVNLTRYITSDSQFLDGDQTHMTKIKTL